MVKREPFNCLESFIAAPQTSFFLGLGDLGGDGDGDDGEGDLGDGDDGDGEGDLGDGLVGGGDGLAVTTALSFHP